MVLVPFSLWTRLWKSFPELEGVFADEHPDSVFADEDADAFAELLAEVLCLLYSQSDAVPVELLVRSVAEALAETAATEDPGSEPVREVLERVLDQWESMGALRRFTTSSPEQVALIGAVAPAGAESDRTVVELLPLGVWAARESLRESGFTAPTVDELLDEPAEVLALALATSPADVVEEVVAGWVERRGAPAAAAEIAALLRGVDDPAVRLNALVLLEHTEM